MQISLEKYEEMQDRIANLEVAIEIKSKQFEYALDLVVERDDEIYRLRAKQPHWISVKDRLPETVKPVVFLALEPDGKSACAWVAWSDQKEDALYWAELPELPEEAKDETD